VILTNIHVFFFYKITGKDQKISEKDKYFSLFCNKQTVSDWTMEHFFLAQNNTYKNIHLTVSFAIGKRIFTTE